MNLYKLGTSVLFIHLDVTLTQGTQGLNDGLFNKRKGLKCYTIKRTIKFEIILPKKKVFLRSEKKRLL